jgi:four helix bundle protein
VGVRRYEDLDVWKLAEEVRLRIVDLTDRPTLRAHYWLSVQLRKAANSACANIAEGFSRFRPGDFARFMRIARGSLAELQQHLREPEIQRTAAADEQAELAQLIDRAMRASARLIAYLGSAVPPQTPDH